MTRRTAILREIDRLRDDLANATYSAEVEARRSEAFRERVEGLEKELEARPPGPLPLLLWCPTCHARHIDRGEFATKLHHTHACQSCGMVWRPAIVATVGVDFLPGFKDGGVA